MRLIPAAPQHICLAESHYVPFVELLMEPGLRLALAICNNDTLKGAQEKVGTSLSPFPLPHPLAAARGQASGQRVRLQAAGGDPD